MLFLTPTTSDLSPALPEAPIIEMKNFPDGESYVRIPSDVGGEDVILIHRAYPNPDENLMKLFLAASTIKIMKPSSLKMLVPYLPYARMDKTVRSGEAVSADILCSILNHLGCDELITIDCHFIKEGEGTFQRSGLRIRNITASKVLIDEIKRRMENPIVISPDQGASYMSGGLAMKKVRGGYSEAGGATYRKVAQLEMSFDVKNRDVAIIDDIISTGSTMIKAVERIREAGARKICCAATHGLFLADSFHRLKEAGVEEIITTDTIVSKASKVKFLDVVRGVIL